MDAIPDYQMLDCLHESDRSMVYRAIRHADNQPVVLKWLKSQSALLLDRYRQEYGLLRALNLPGVIQVYDLLTQQNSLVMVLEDIGGESLTILQRDRRFTLSEILYLGVQIAECLSALHTAKLVHYNINPDHIVWNPETNHLRLIDFKLAAVQLSEQSQQHLPTLHPLGLLEGTLAYMSPEQTGRMNRALDYRTDFYSLGVMLYEILTGTLPFTATDPLELVHCHIAQTAVAPHLLSDTIPLPVSQVIMKLLAKNPDDRYQSGIGIRADCQRCLGSWQQSGRIEPFALGAEDIVSRFQIPAQLYGREREMATLCQALERVVQKQRPEVVLIAGESGIGKTSLGQSLRSVVEAHSGYLITGKFEQQYTAAATTIQPIAQHPYAALISAFSDLIHQLLMSPDTVLAAWRTKLQTTLGTDSQLIAEVIPHLELVLGKQTAPALLPSHDRQDRFHLAFQNLIQVFTQANQLLVLVLDDLHWADPASLKLLQLLVTIPNSQLLLVGTYRTESLKTNHPLVLRLAELAGQMSVQTITLAPLDLAAVTALTADTLHRSLEDSQPLAALVVEKTGGNPLFVKEFLTLLQRRNLIWFHPTAHQWQWQLEAIQTLDITDNEATLLAEKMQSLSVSTQHVLTLAACLGSSFELVTLVAVAQQSARETAACLWGAVVEGFIVPLDNAGQTAGISSPVLSRQFMVKYRFAHDRIRQAAYNLVPVERRSALHWQIGQQLLHQTPAEKRDEKIFDIVTQLNAGIAQATTQTERIQLAWLNLLAGKKARLTAAAEAALNYCQVGITLLQADGWQSCYDMMLELHQRAAGAAYLNANYTQVEALIAAALPYVSNVLDRLSLQDIQLQALKAQNRELDAIAIALPLLAELGVYLPQHPRYHDLLWARVRTQVALLGQSNQVNQPTMTDPIHLAAMHLLSSLVTVATSAAPNLVPLVLVEQLWLSRRFGHTAESALAYAIYGAMLCATGDTPAGDRLGKRAIALLEVLNTAHLQATIRQTIVASITPWKEHARNTLSELLVIHRTALDIGDLTAAAACLSLHSYYAWFTGMPLPQATELMATASTTIAALKQESVLHVHHMGWQLLLNLKGESNDPRVLSGVVYDRGQMLAFHEQANDTTSLLILNVLQLVLAYTFQEYGQALVCANAAAQYHSGSTISLIVILFNTYQSLACLAAIPTASPVEKQTLWQQVTTNQKILRRWAMHAPMNCLHRVYLVEAECQWLRGQIRRATGSYDRAIALAHQHGYIQDAALAKERAALFHNAQGQANIASSYLQDAYLTYRQWGALAKVVDLEQRYPQVLTQITLSSSVYPSLGKRGDLTTVNLDLAAVIRASQAISGEIVLSRLLERIMTIVLENAGAQTGYLLSEQANQIMIEVKGTLERYGPQVEQVSLVATDEYVPLSLIRYVAQTREDVVINDASSSVSSPGKGQASSYKFIDPYITRHQVHSLLCIPLLSQGKLTGMLYLENNVMTGAFTPDRLEILRLLCSQAAISLENARLYERLEGYSQTLEEKVQERTQELQQQIRDRAHAEESLQQAKEAAEIANRAKSEFLSKMSHELRTPLNAILGFTQVLTRDPALTRHQRKFIEIISRSGEYLLSLINDVLEMSRIEAGQISLNPVSIDLYRLLDSLTEMLQLKAESNGLRLTCDRSSDLPRFVTADESKLRQVLINLLGNAIKFTQQGHVTLRVSLVSLEGEGLQVGSRVESREVNPPHSPRRPFLSTLHFQVEDTGPGIAPEEMDLLFQAFSQTETGRKSQQGSGLGLAISKQFVQLMGGQIGVQSIVGKGSTFWFTVPITLSSPVTLQATPRVVGLAPNQPTYRILIVENSWESRQLMLKLLSLPGLDVKEAVDGAEAIEKWQTWQPHLIWMDMQMPVLDGFQATQQIRDYEMAIDTATTMAVNHGHSARLSGRDSGSDCSSAAQPSTAQNRDNIAHSDAHSNDNSDDNSDNSSDNNGQVHHTHELPTNGKAQKTIIIALTASAFEDDRLRSLAAGCDDFVRKPFSEGLLFEKMAEHLGIQLLYDAGAQEHPDNSPEPTASEAPLSLPELAAHLDDMPQDWLSELQTATTRLDTESVLQLLNHIPPQHSPIAHVITDWVNNFRFDKIIELLSSANR